MKTSLVKGLDGERHLMFWCPGCDEAHGPIVKRGTFWIWNGARERPTGSGPMITLILVLVIIGFCLYLLDHFVPQAEPIRLLVIALVVIYVVLWLLRAFGVPGVPQLPL